MTLTRESGYPKYTKDATGIVKSDRLYGPWAEAKSYLFDLRLGLFDTVDNMKLLSANMDTNENGGIGRINMQYANYSTAGAFSIVPSSQVPFTSELETSVLEKPIESHSDYRVIWNYHLAADPDTSTAMAGYADATTLEISVANSDKYAWIKEPSELPLTSANKRWHIQVYKTKPGQESYFLPSTIVREKYYIDSQYEGYKIAENTAKRKSPTITYFGITGGEWLNLGGRVYKDDKKWIAETSYQWADSWDHDLYST